MTKQIPLTQGKFALVDDEDYERVSQHKWFAQHTHSTWYACRNIKSNGKNKAIFMHRFILDAPDGTQTDHADNDGLNNTRSNIRTCTVAENNRNRRSWRRFKGVYHMSAKCHLRKPWFGYIEVNGRKVYLGSFATEIEGARAYDAAARKYFGEFAKTNF